MQNSKALRSQRWDKARRSGRHKAVLPWESTIVSQRENGTISWQSVPGSAVFVEGAVQKSETALSHHTPELVMHLLDGSYYSDWKRK